MGDYTVRYVIINCTIVTAVITIIKNKVGCIHL